MAPVPGPRNKRQNITEEVCPFKLANNVTTDLFNFLLTLSDHLLSLYYYCFIIVFSLYYHDYRCRPIVIV